MRTELTHCSGGDMSGNSRYLVKAIRLEGSNLPPIANAGPDQLQECTEHAGHRAMLDGTGSSDPNDDPLTFAWNAPGIGFDDPASSTPAATFPKGTTTVTLEVSDGEETDSDEVDIQVVDSTPPSISCPADVLVECTSAGGVDATHPEIAAFLSGAVASDTCDAAPMLLDNGPALYQLGNTQVTFTATDADGNFSNAQPP